MPTLVGREVGPTGFGLMSTKSVGLQAEIER